MTQCDDEKFLTAVLTTNRLWMDVLVEQNSVAAAADILGLESYTLLSTWLLLVSKLLQSWSTSTPWWK